MLSDVYMAAGREEYIGLERTKTLPTKTQFNQFKDKVAKTGSYLCKDHMENKERMLTFEQIDQFIQEVRKRKNSNVPHHQEAIDLIHNSERKDTSFGLKAM